MGNLVFEIGQLEYFRISLETDKTMYFIIAGAVGAVLLLFIVILVCYNRRKQKKQKKKVDNIARELETLESKVARECREGETSSASGFLIINNEKNEVKS